MNQPIERIQRDRLARTQPALRLVDTRKIERADWLEVRKSGIGGSDAAAAEPEEGDQKNLVKSFNRANLIAVALEMGGVIIAVAVIIQSGVIGIPAALV
mgnify:CR=1 FL=1